MRDIYNIISVLRARITQKQDSGHSLMHAVLYKCKYAIQSTNMEHIQVPHQKKQKHNEIILYSQIYLILTY